MTRPACLLVALLSAVQGFGCRGSSQRPLNPVLENAQANLLAVKSRLGKKPELKDADYFELGMAKYRVWSIYLARSRYPAGTTKTRRKAAANRRKAERIEPEVIEAFKRAAGSPDPHLASKAKVRLAWVYGKKRDWDQQVALLAGILRDHGDLNDPQVFGAGRTPHYYCYYTMWQALKAKGAPRAAIDCLARALLAIDMGEKAGVDFRGREALLVGELVDYEPRIVLPKYQRLLPARIDELPGSAGSGNRTGPAPALARMFEEYRKKATVHIELTVDHVDHNGALIAYEVLFPDYPKIIEEWQREQQDPRPHLPDDFGYLKPTFRLSFVALPAGECFATNNNVPDYTKTALGPASATGPLAFDPTGRSVGRIIVKWSDKAPRPLGIYLVAKLERRHRGWGPAVSPEQSYVEPVGVMIPLPP